MTQPQQMDIVVIGAMKAATSTICAYLEDHPDVFMVPNCEPNYFSIDDNFAKGQDWYHSHFAGQGTERFCAEGSNYYAARDLYPDSAARMAAYNPKARIIYMVRNPLKRIVSAWIQNRANRGDQVPPSLDRAVAEMPARFVGQSLYWHNIAPYREHFGDDQIFVGFMEDLNRNPVEFYAALCAFLEITPKLEAERGHQNKSVGKRIPSETYTRVNRLPFVGALKSVLPRGLKTTVKDRLLSQSADDTPVFSQKVRQDLITTLRPDAEAFLAHYGKESGYWSFE